MGAVIRQTGRDAGRLLAAGAVIVALAAGAAGCPSAPPPVATPTPTPPATPTPTPVSDPRDALRAVTQEVPLLDDAGDWKALRESVDKSLSWFAVQRPERVFVYGPRTVTAREMREALVRFRALLEDEPTPAVLAARVRAEFDLLESVGGIDGTVLFTGYYEPTIEASLTRRKGYEVPIHGRPRDIVEIPLAAWGDRVTDDRTILGRIEGKKILPYWSREDIGRGRLRGKRLEIAWAKDAVDLFFLEIQGSGTLKLPDGRTRRIGYAGSNGRMYRSIGSLLIEEGAIEADLMSMQALRTWLAAHPEERNRVLDHNESYVFFRFLPGGPVGSLNRPVTPGRSIATDMSLLPPGGLAFVETEFPRMTAGTGGTATAAGRVEWHPLTRFVLNQDTGGAIKGPGRVDVFWGQGEEAALAAGLMKQRGRLFFLVPKAPAVSASGSATPPAP